MGVDEDKDSPVDRRGRREGRQPGLTVPVWEGRDRPRAIGFRSLFTLSCRVNSFRGGRKVADNRVWVPGSSSPRVLLCESLSGRFGFAIVYPGVSVEDPGCLEEEKGGLGGGGGG